MNLPKFILLIENDRDDQLFFTEAIDQIEGVRLLGIAHNGKEALEHLSESLFLPDIIFMDINMPVMNGIECLIQLKKRPWFKHIPVVMLSSSLNDMDTARKLGAKAFLKKEYDEFLLRAQLEKVIHSDFECKAHASPKHMIFKKRYAARKCFTQLF